MRALVFPLAALLCGAAHAKLVEQLPRDWFQAFRGAGGSAEFKQLPPHGDDGHQLFAKFPQAWQPVVADFLPRQGFTAVTD